MASSIYQIPHVVFIIANVSFFGLMSIKSTEFMELQ